MLLITGCGRSGTKYAYQVLNELGIFVGHEVSGKEGTVDWHLAYNPSGYDVVLHQVRNPLQVISSCHTIMEKSWKFIAKHELRISLEDSVLIRSMKYWLYWNQQAESIAKLTYRVEEMPVRKIAGLCRKQVSRNATDKINSVSRSHHSRKKSKTYKIVTVNDLREADEDLFSQIADLATRYGYQI